MFADSLRQTTRIYLSSVHYFSIFSVNGTFWFVEKTDICNFADNNTIAIISKQSNVIENLQSDLRDGNIKLVYKDNQMMANPGKF